MCPHVYTNLHTHHPSCMYMCRHLPRLVCGYVWNVHGPAYRHACQALPDLKDLHNTDFIHLDRSHITYWEVSLKEVCEAIKMTQ